MPNSSQNEHNEFHKNTGDSEPAIREHLVCFYSFSRGRWYNNIHNRVYIIKWIIHALFLVFLSVIGAASLMFHIWILSASFSAIHSVQVGFPCSFVRAVGRTKDNRMMFFVLPTTAAGFHIKVNGGLQNQRISPRPSIFNAYKFSQEPKLKVAHH